MGKETDQHAAETSHSLERELCLVADRSTREAAFAAPPLTSKAEGDEKTVDLDNRYFDTSDYRLRDKGLALRVRIGNEGNRQTLKAGDDAQSAVLSRGEWETALEDDRPRLEALPGRARQLIPEGVQEDDLDTVFRTTFQRRTRRLIIDQPDKPATIEAALDLGAIDAGEDELPIAEIELELLDGAPASLYQLALELQEMAPLRFETRSKSSRAFDYMTGEPPDWHKATEPVFKHAGNVDQAMAAIFKCCFDQWLANQAAAIDGRDAEGVHQMRVGLRRLRSALSIFKKLIPKSQRAWLQPGAKEAASHLGPARDWDVFLDDLLMPAMRAQPDNPELRALRTRAKSMRASAYRSARKRLAERPYNHFLPRFGQWLERQDWRRERSKKQVKLGASLDRRFCRPSPRRTAQGGLDPWSRLYRPADGGTAPASDRSQETPLRRRVLRSAVQEKRRQTLRRQPEGASRRSWSPERCRGRRGAPRQPHCQTGKGRHAPTGRHGDWLARTRRFRSGTPSRP